MLHDATLIYNRLAAVSDALTRYAITAETIESQKQKIDASNDMIAVKDTGYDSRKAAREKLSDQFDQADQILKEELDKLIDKFIDSHPDFHNEYQAARSIHDLRGHSSSNTTPPQN